MAVGSLSPGRAVTVFDIGGTSLRSGRWRDGDGDRIGGYRELPAPSLLRDPAADVSELRSRLVGMVCDATPREPDPVAGISLGAALDHRSGTVYASAPMWGDWIQPFDLHRALAERRPDVAWHIVNDVTAAVRHFASTEACRDRERVMLVTVSSGIACRVLDRSSGRIVVDGSGLQGEIGHLPASTTLSGKRVELDCDCGEPGHVASFGSGPGIQRMAAALRSSEPARWEESGVARAIAAGAGFETAFKLALDAEDGVAQELLTAAVRPLAVVLSTALTLDPGLDRIGITGGVAAGLGEHYRCALTRLMLQTGPYLTTGLTPGWVTDRVVICEPDGASGLVGAGLAALSAESGHHQGDT